MSGYGLGYDEKKKNNLGQGLSPKFSMVKLIPVL